MKARGLTWDEEQRGDKPKYLHERKDQIKRVPIHPQHAKIEQFILDVFLGRYALLH